MFKKREFMILLLLLACIFTISSASAAGDTDAVASADVTDVAATNGVADVVTTDEASAGDIATNLEENQVQTTVGENNSGEVQTIGDSPNDDELTADQTSEVVGAVNPWSFTDHYTFSLEKSYTISGSNGGKIVYYYHTATDGGNTYYQYAYQVQIFKSMKDNGDGTLTFYDKVFEKDHKTTKTSTTSTYMKGSQTIPAGLELGSYVINIRNIRDGVSMAHSTLIVGENAVITANNVYKYYHAPNKLTIVTTDKDTGKRLGNLWVKVTFVKSDTGAKTVKWYRTNSNGWVSIVPPLAVGKYSVYYGSSWTVKPTSTKTTVSVWKSNVYVGAYKAIGYQGCKAKLKAVVKCAGKNVNQGVVIFKVNGKAYTASVKNGVAVAYVKMKWTGAFVYKAKFVGYNYNTKEAKSVAKVYKRIATKILFKNYVVRYGEIKDSVIKIRTADGQKVRGGWLKVKNCVEPTFLVKVSNKGKVWGLKTMSIWTDFYKANDGYRYYYKKAVNRYAILKYIPENQKYLPSKGKICTTTLYKCPICGSTGTHYHNWGYYYTKIIVS